jgi:hypothetical protein
VAIEGLLAVEELIIPLIVLLVIVVVLMVVADELLVPVEPEPAEELELLATYTHAAPLKAKPM